MQLLWLCLYVGAHNIAVVACVSQLLLCFTVYHQGMTRTSDSMARFDSCFYYTKIQHIQSCREMCVEAVGLVPIQTIPQ